ncbi:allantoate amidohydrolase [Luedemannella helvata]|uniref:Allantoate amidohydrolase n=1 Tax=Luedemannella helvata TaxID=349315 RepID=A0ABP4WKU5_9ACTN
MSVEVVERFRALWRSLEKIGRDEATGGYRRHGWDAHELACREWFAEEAADRELTVREDGNGNVFAWWGEPRTGDAVLTGSHFDSVPDGGGYDGPLGIVSALLAVDLLRERGATPRRPIVIGAFAEEEGSRFGLACLGSRLLTGVTAADTALALTDRDGVTLTQAIMAAGGDPATVGPDPELLSRFGCFVELHIEQGRALADLNAPVGLASAIWPHGRWRFEFVGDANHAGTTRMADRHDPMLTFAFTVLAANKEARLSGAHATMGRVAVRPNATNAVPGRVTAWLDARAATQSTLDGLIMSVTAKATERAARDGTTVTVTAESVTPVVDFDAALRDRLRGALNGIPVLPTGAGHDAGVLSAVMPTAMLFVRNPSGVSHAPAEHATDEDCAAGVEALATALEELACR